MEENRYQFLATIASSVLIAMRVLRWRC